ncbi:MAG TPA: hypothetical protein VF189_03080 [Patescibacteria group bacterium]
MNFGFDLDGVFVSLPPFLPAWIIESLYRDRDHTKLTYRMPGNLEQKIRKLSHIPLFRPPLKRNITFLKSFAKQNKYNLYLISSRFGFLNSISYSILKRYGLEKIFHRVYFNTNNKQPHIFKDEIIKKLKIRYFVDDDLYLLKYLAQHNKTTTFYWFNSKTEGKIGENLIAITNLEQIL